MGNCAIVRAYGEIDISSAPGLRAALSRSDAIHLVIDLRGVSFLDSTGLGVLVGALKRLQKQDGTLSIVVGRGRIRRLFEITRLTGVFELSATFPGAIAGNPHWQGALTAAGHADIAGWCREHGLHTLPATTRTLSAALFQPGQRNRLSGGHTAFQSGYAGLD